MKQRRKAYFALSFLLLLCCACNKEKVVSVESWGSSKPDAGVRISAEVVSKETEDACAMFEVKVGIGNCGIYNTGILKVDALGFEIKDAEGTACTDMYTCRYEGFNEEAYGYRIEDEQYLGLKYSEILKFKYVGDGENGEIRFWIDASQQGEKTSEEKQKSGVATVSFFYYVKDGEMTLTAEQPFEDGFPLLTEAK